MRDRLRSVGRKVLQLPGLRNLMPTVRRFSAVTEPAGLISIRNQPAILTSRNCVDLTVMSANLWHDWPRQRGSIERLQSFSQMVESQGVDVLLVQEVARTPDLKVDEWLSERLGMAYVYSRANGHASGIGFEEGLAVYSRYPIKTLYLRRLGKHTNPFVRRLALGAVIDSPCGKLLTFSVHLGLLNRQNYFQLSDLWNWVADVGGESPVLIGGDFNAHETSSQIRQTQTVWLDTFRRINPTEDGTTHELRGPFGGLLRRARLDYIFLRPGKSRWKVVDARHIHPPGVVHSDHRAVLARMVPVFS